VLKLRDRGDISRHSAVSIAGFDYDSEVQSRKREKKDDKIMVPADVPFSKPGQPADNGGGRPAGGSSANGAPGSQPSRSTKDSARPSKVVTRNAGETVRAMYEEGVGSYRVGELTYVMLEEYADTQRTGRLTPHERAALDRIAKENWPDGPILEGPVAVIPVNPDYDVEDVRVVRLADGLSMLVGDRIGDDALVARAIVVRDPVDPLVAEEMAMRWGFITRRDDEPEGDE
jgi:hypothetical protein